MAIDHPMPQVPLAAGATAAAAGATAAAAGAGARASADARATVERLATQPRAVAFVTWWFVTWSGNKRNKRRYTN